MLGYNRNEFNSIWALKAFCFFPEAIFWLLLSTDCAVSIFMVVSSSSEKCSQQVLRKQAMQLVQILFFSSQGTTSKIPFTFTEMRWRLRKISKLWKEWPKQHNKQHPHNFVATVWWRHFPVLTQQAHIVQNESVKKWFFPHWCGRTLKYPSNTYHTNINAWCC